MNDLCSITVLIPVFNTDISELVATLINQIVLLRQLSARFSIICLDDFSTNTNLKNKNRDFFNTNIQSFVKYYESPVNLGRGQCRNKLAQLANSNWLIFLDADVMIDGKDFLLLYLNMIAKNEFDVICGGTSYMLRTMNQRKYNFYYNYFSNYGLLSAEDRNKRVWQTLLTSNIAVRKEIFQNICFNDDFIGYGYEDQEWAIRLQRISKVIHIDNTVSHLGLQTKHDFLAKMKESVVNYHLLGKIHPNEFRQTRIAFVVSYLLFMPMRLLKIADIFLNRLFISFNENLKIQHFLYQFNKAILLTIAYKKERMEKLW